MRRLLAVSVALLWSGCPAPAPSNDAGEPEEEVTYGGPTENSGTSPEPKRWDGGNLLDGGAFSSACCMREFKISDLEPLETEGQLRLSIPGFGEGLSLSRDAGLWQRSVCIPVGLSGPYDYLFKLDAGFDSDAGEALFEIRQRAASDQPTVVDAHGVTRNFLTACADAGM